MKWRGRRASGNIEDRRGAGGGDLLGGLGGLINLGSGNSSSSRSGCGLKGGLGTIVVVAIIWLLGGNPLDILTQLAGTGGFGTETRYTTAEDDTLKQFVEVVLADTEDVWTAVFRQMGKTYRNPTLVLFSGYTNSGCGAAQSSTGPFYCSVDEKIYVDLSFFQEMRTKFRAGGDFAYAYVIAHEVGHHVQKLLGTLEKNQNERAQASEKRANQLSVQLELQADFYAGVWAHYTESMFNSLDDTDINEALNAAEAVGDDRLQKQAQGYVVPDSFTHGSSEQRHEWFYKGYRSGNMNQANTAR
ncbi:MAG: zinc metallopeptidase [Bacteroidales bacterium]|jgi:predicted metalloprotease|nr:zinc metallopeptidase [Bacteroidales bacterium]